MYKESGKYNLSGLMASYLIGAILAFVLGYVYSVFILTIPIVYFNVVISIGFGLIVSFVVLYLVRIFHIRNKKASVILTFVIALLFNYFQWGAYILFASYGDIPTIKEFFSSISFWLFKPGYIIELLKEINQFGMWSVAGVTFKGWGLTSIWILEFLLILLVPTLLVYKSRIYPYSEDQNAWYSKFTLLRNFKSVFSVNQLVEDLSQDIEEAFDKLGKGNSMRHAKVHVYKCEKDPISYLMVENVISGRKGTPDKTIMIEYLNLNNQDTEVLLSKYDYQPPSRYRFVNWFNK